MIPHAIKKIDNGTLLTYTYFMEEIMFEWDENKRKVNLEKHGLDFVAAAHVFYDTNRIAWKDTRKDYKEIRYRTVGLVEDLLIHVVYTERNSAKRIISVRRAHKNERKKYKEI